MVDVRMVRATFVFTDIEGSTRLVRELGDGFVDVLEDHRRYIRSEITSHGGREVGTDGDSFFVVFDDAAAALQAVAEMQRALTRHDWPAPLAIRVGLHTGEAIEADDDFVGLDIHVTARVAAAAHGGQIVCTEETLTAAGGAQVPIAMESRHQIKRQLPSRGGHQADTGQASRSST